MMNFVCDAKLQHRRDVLLHVPKHLAAYDKTRTCGSVPPKRCAIRRRGGPSRPTKFSISICQGQIERALKMDESKNLFAAAIAGITALTFGNQRAWSAPEEFADIKAQITRQHDEAVKRLQDWIHQISIAAENRGYPEGADYMINLLKEAGFQRAERVETDGKPGVFATLDAGAPKTIGLYFMYDVKQFDPKNGRHRRRKRRLSTSRVWARS